MIESKLNCRSIRLHNLCLCQEIARLSRRRKHHCGGQRTRKRHNVHKAYIYCMLQRAPRVEKGFSVAHAGAVCNAAHAHASVDAFAKGTVAIPQAVDGGGLTASVVRIDDAAAVALACAVSLRERPAVASEAAVVAAALTARVTHVTTCSQQTRTRDYAQETIT